MRWPWQRPERPVTDAPAPTRPAGWAFLPPLQRQVSDAPPATLRPAFVSTLPTRAVPASLGSMGHLVDDTAPSGTVAVDDRTLGTPVQRAVATDLTLLPRPAPPAPSRPVAQRVDDPGSLDSPAESAAPGPEWANTRGDGAPAPRVFAQPRPTIAGESSSEPEAVIAAEDMGAAGPPIEADVDAPPVSGSAVEASTPGVSPTPRAPAVATPAPLVRPTLQRSAVDATPSPGTVSSRSVAPSAPPNRRPGLGAPLPPRSMQRAPDAATPGTPPRSPAGIDGPASSESSDGAPTTGLPRVQERADAPAASSLQRDLEAPGEALLLGASPLDSSLGEGGRAPDVSHPASSNAHPGSSSTTPTSAFPVAVQRSAPGADEPTAHVIDAYAYAEAGQDAPDDAHASPHSDSDPSVGLPRRQEHALVAEAQGVFPPAPPVQRTVPLFGVQRLTPSITARAHVPARRVVVARALAPEPPPPITANVAARNTSGAARSSSAAAPAGDAGTATGWSQATPDTTSVAHAGAGADLSLGWPPAEASVSRLVDPPSSGGDHEPPAGMASPRSREAVASVQRAESTAPVGSLASRPSVAAVAASDAVMPVVSRHAAEQAEHPRMPLVAVSPGMDVVQRAIDATVQRAETATPVPEAPAEPVEPEASVAEPGGSTGGAHTSVAPAPPAPAGENVEQLARKLYGPLVRRIKAELLLDRERRGIRIDGI